MVYGSEHGTATRTFLGDATVGLQAPLPSAAAQCGGRANNIPVRLVGWPARGRCCRSGQTSPVRQLVTSTSAGHHHSTRTDVLHYGALMHCCRVNFHTQTGVASAKASLEAQQLTEAVDTLFDLQTGTLHALS